MEIDRTALRLSVGIAGTGVLANAITGSLVLVFGFQFLFEPTVVPVYETWFDAVIWIGTGITFGILPVAAIGAFYLVAIDRSPVIPVIGGFLLGGIFYGVGIGTANWLVSQPTFAPVLEFVRGGVVATVVFIGMAILGSIGGDVLGSRVRESNARG